MIDEDLLRESHGSKASSSQEMNPFIQQRSHSMFIQNDSNFDDLIDFNQPNLNSNKKNKKRGGASKKKKSPLGEVNHLASKV